jgi:hypothetical protein
MMLLLLECCAQKGAGENSDAEGDEESSELLRVIWVRGERGQQEDDEEEILAFVRGAGGGAGNDEIRAGLHDRQEEGDAGPLGEKGRDVEEAGEGEGPHDYLEHGLAFA